MKSIKPGRGPSKFNVFASICVALFGVFWCILAFSMGAVFMVPFGIIFVVLAIGQAIYSYHNATSEDRYSIVDIVDEDEESDPLNIEKKYCPYCGTKVNNDYEYCPKCGKKLN